MNGREISRLIAVMGATLVGLGGCARPPAQPPEASARRVPILDPEYGAHPTHPEALAPGERLELAPLELADGGQLELDEALSAGSVVLVWIGGAEHEALTAWVQRLEASLAQIEARGASLVFVRPLEAAAALRWAVELRLQSAVACDREGELGERLDLLRAPDRGQRVADFAVLVLEAGGELRYRKLGGRRPEFDELAAVLDGEGAALSCCPGACVGEPCVGLELE